MQPQRDLYLKQKGIGDNPTRGDWEYLIRNIEDEEVEQMFKDKFTLIRNTSMRQYKYLLAMMYNHKWDKLKDFIINIK